MEPETKQTKASSNPIGVFDSGVGGLTVLKTLAQEFPNENFIYLGDTARLPYGTKSPVTIYNYSQQIIEYLFAKNVKAIIIACNSASSHYKNRFYSGIPIYNVIEPGAIMALRMTSNHRIGILGTRATVNSKSYVNAIHNLSAETQVFQMACPLLVPLAEEGWIHDPITNLIAYRYIQSLLNHQIDTLVLGCTHYPILREAIQKAVGMHVSLVESGVALAEILHQELCASHWQANTQDPHLRQIDLLTTDGSEHFLYMARDILNPLQVDSFKGVDL